MKPRNPGHGILGEYWKAMGFMNGNLPKRDSDHGSVEAISSAHRVAGKWKPPHSLSVFVVRRKRWTLTWSGRLLFLVVFTIITVTLVRGLYGFLAINIPIGGDLLVVEGWLPTFAYREAAKEFRKGHYTKVIAVGVLREDGLAGGDSTEDFGADRLVRFGVPGDLVMSASYSEIQRDRTFHSAMAMKEWLQKQGVQATSIDVVTIGPHARRSRLLYQKALGDDVQVGVIAIPDWRVDPDHWWRSSEGARTVISETIGYVYAKLFYSPDS